TERSFSRCWWPSSMQAGPPGCYALQVQGNAHELSSVFIELGVAIVGLAVLARLASRWGFSAIPLYLLAGLAFGTGGLAPLNFSRDFVHSGAEIGVLL